MHWYLRVYERTFDIRGRSSRTEFWTFQFLNYFILSIVNHFIVYLSSGLVIYYLYIFWTAIASITLTIRRLHDINRTGWWIWIPFITFFFYFVKGDPHINKYGSPPPPLNINYSRFDQDDYDGDW